MVHELFPELQKFQIITGSQYILQNFCRMSEIQKMEMNMSKTRWKLAVRRKTGNQKTPEDVTEWKSECNAMYMIILMKYICSVLYVKHKYNVYETNHVRRKHVPSWKPDHAVSMLNFAMKASCCSISSRSKGYPRFCTAPNSALAAARTVYVISRRDGRQVWVQN